MVLKTISDCKQCPHLTQCDAHITFGDHKHGRDQILANWKFIRIQARSQIDFYFYSQSNVSTKNKRRLHKRG